MGFYQKQSVLYCKPRAAGKRERLLEKERTMHAEASAAGGVGST
jgi:hypothetical protein